jgi:hypothetical protein
VHGETEGSRDGKRKGTTKKTRRHGMNMKEDRERGRGTREKAGNGHEVIEHRG